MGITFDPYNLKTTRLLKSIIEQMLKDLKSLKNRKCLKTHHFSFELKQKGLAPQIRRQRV